MNPPPFHWKNQTKKSGKPSRVKDEPAKWPYKGTIRDRLAPELGQFEYSKLSSLFYTCSRVFKLRNPFAKKVNQPKQEAEETHELLAWEDRGCEQEEEEKDAFHR
jgi:hypothetical protein